MFYIFERFEASDSLGKIFATLADMKIVSPTGKVTWSWETISKLLANEKYVGDVVLGKTQVVDGVQIKSSDARSQVHMKPAIIPMNSLILFRRKDVNGAGIERLVGEWLEGQARLFLLADMVFDFLMYGAVSDNCKTQCVNSPLKDNFIGKLDIYLVLPWA